MSVIIVGGGMAGMTLALALSQRTAGALKIDVIEARALDRQSHSGFDGRSLALALGTCQKLDDIGIWSSLKEHAEAITSIRISDKGHLGGVTLNASDHHLTSFGHVVELYETGAKLFSLLKRHANIRLHCPAKVVAVTRTQEQVCVELDDGNHLYGQLAVAADGADSALAAAINITRQRIDYGQVAVIANVEFASSLPGVAFERFTQHGPLALLPITRNRYSLVWCRHAQEQDEIMSLSDELFIERLQREFGWRLGKLKRVGRRESYVLALNQAERVISHRVALVGNASQTLHPVAGQGFNLAMRDVMTLAEMVASAWFAGQDLGGYDMLRDYPLKRDVDRRLTVNATSSLVKLFSTTNVAASVVRNLMMLAIDNNTLLQHLLVQQAISQYRR